jgi:hypothetical protein
MDLLENFVNILPKPNVEKFGVLGHKTCKQACRQNRLVIDGLSCLNSSAKLEIKLWYFSCNTLTT